MEKVRKYHGLNVEAMSLLSSSLLSSVQVQWLHALILKNQTLPKEHIEISIAMFSRPTVIFNMACHYVIRHAGMNPKNTKRSVQPVKHIPEINL